MNIFLIEDDEAIGMGLKYSLEKEGYNVVLGKSRMDADQNSTSKAVEPSLNVKFGILGD